MTILKSQISKGQENIYSWIYLVDHKGWKGIVVDSQVNLEYLQIGKQSNKVWKIKKGDHDGDQASILILGQYSSGNMKYRLREKCPFGCENAWMSWNPSVYTDGLSVEATGPATVKHTDIEWEGSNESPGLGGLNES